MSPNQILRSTILSLLAVVILGLGASGASADQVFVTPTGQTLGGEPVNGRVTFSQSGNILNITLENLQANPTSVIQTISGLRFSISTAGGTLTSSSAEHIDIAGDGTYLSSGLSATDWILTSSSGNYFLNGLGGNGPDETLIGSPDGSNVYSNANSSIAGNSSHNPFLQEIATFSLTIPGLPPGTVVTNVVFQFGTGDDRVGGVPGGLTGVPEPATMLLLGTGLVAVGVRRRQRNQGGGN
jgi:hypothetical protein